MRTVEFLFLLFLASAQPLGNKNFVVYFFPYFTYPTNDSIYILEEGDACNLPNGQNGTCVKVNDCAFAQEQLENQQHPEMCTSQKYSSLACCIKTSSRILRKPGVLSDESKMFLSEWKISHKKKSVAECRLSVPYGLHQILIFHGKASAAEEFPHMVGERHNKQIHDIKQVLL